MTKNWAKKGQLLDYLKGEAKLDLFSTPGSKRRQVDCHDEKMVPQVQKSPVASKTQFLKSKNMNTQDFKMFQ